MWGLRFKVYVLFYELYDLVLSPGIIIIHLLSLLHTTNPLMVWWDSSQWSMLFLECCRCLLGWLPTSMMSEVYCNAQKTLMYNSFKSTITPAFLKRTMPFVLQLENMSQSLHNQKQTNFFLDKNGLISFVI